MMLIIGDFLCCVYVIKRGGGGGLLFFVPRPAPGWMNCLSSGHCLDHLADCISAVD